MLRRAIARPPASTKYTSPPFATDLTTPALGEAVPSNPGHFQSLSEIVRLALTQKWRKSPMRSHGADDCLHLRAQGFAPLTIFRPTR